MRLLMTMLAVLVATAAVPARQDPPTIETLRARAQERMRQDLGDLLG